MSQQMIDLKVELEMLNKAEGKQAWTLDAVTYSTSGESTPGVHLPGGETILDLTIPQKTQPIDLTEM